MATAKMKIHLPLVVWITILTNYAHAQGGIGFGIRKEIFFLNLEDGYFGCQVNESTDVLQLYEISRICDGTPDCYRGSDELQRELKCTSDCHKKDGLRCQNGACLDHQCHCNDGFGGCSCEVPDENECKNRPCDVFAHCTNSLGSFHCTCFPGYQGDGFYCQDINECEDPTIAARCVENAECCNLPAHFVCKCLPGFEGDGEIECRDINECTHPGVCGHNALCQNVPGNYTCQCLEGYAGNPFLGCEDINECTYEGACGPGAICTNVPGGHTCACPPGYDGDPLVNGCVDANECARNPCGRNALCSNLPGSFKCDCPPGSIGDPMHQCQDINECKQNPCGSNAVCTDTVGSFTCSCKEDYTGDPFKGCVDIDECTALDRPCGTNAICENAVPGYNCLCLQGYRAKPDAKVACEQVDVTILCKSKFDCVNNAECVEGQCFCLDGFKAQGSVCVDVDECATQPCGLYSTCTNLPGGFHCNCLPGYIGAPPTISCKEPCKDVTCGDHAFCKPDGNETYCICEDGWTFNPLDIAAGCIDIDECDKVNGPFGRCGANAVCSNTAGSFSCQCLPGFSGNAFKQCFDINECTRPDACGAGAACTNAPGSYSCSCPEGSLPDPDPHTRCVTIVTCKTDKDCPGNAVCDPQQRCLCPEPNIGNDCRHPCEGVVCGPNAQCMLLNSEPKCLCRAGYTGTHAGCIDINECQVNPCPVGAVCNNEPGSYSCQCPGGATGDPYKDGCSQPKVPASCGPQLPCPGTEVCVKDEYTGSNVCICPTGYTRDPASGKCKDINECSATSDRPACGLNAVCKNMPGSYECQCPPGFYGNPFSICEECSTMECQCRPPYHVVRGECVLADCSKDKCPLGAECITISGGVSYCACPKGSRPADDGSCKDVDECVEGQPCGYGAQCVNQAQGFQCVCPPGYGGDPHRFCSPSQVRCVTDGDCTANEKCVQPGECVCPPPYFTDATDGNKCKSPCERFPCGINAQCSPTDPPQCLCLAGFKGDPQQGCVDVNECASNPCAYAARCVNEKGGYKCVCPYGMTGDPYRGGCIGQPKVECVSDAQCSGQLACVNSECVNPCNSLPCGVNAYCEAENHAAWCRCYPGFSENQNGECVSQCDGVMCGRDAQCIVTPAGQTCKCVDGYRGNPFPGGSCVPDVCSTVSPCAAPSVCIGGRCKERCEGVVCGVGATCDPNTNQCVCLPLFVGNPDLLCMQPSEPPVCSPACGLNAHCEYGAVNQCVCNPSTSGNPYRECGPQDKRSCAAGVCGAAALCTENHSGIICECPPGYRGNPYIKCEDVDECIGNACGDNAVCINTPGGFDCRCIDGYLGNPFTGCMPTAPQRCADPATCSCSNDRPCPTGFLCKRGHCKNRCDGVKCGPGAACLNGKCVCPPGLTGNPQLGCKPAGQCSNDADCKSPEICFQLSKSVRKCVEACSKLQCGPNALCVTENHRSSCICADGYSGNPGDLSTGCQPERSVSKVECARDEDCEPGLICAIDHNGINVCANPCANVACGQNEECLTDKQGHPVCQCKSGFKWNPVSSSCQKPSLPDCKNNEDCVESAECKPDPLGILKCAAICVEFTCPSNAACVATNHAGHCQCLPGFTGNPNDRDGCKPALRNQCNQDSQCAEVETCRMDSTSGALSCQSACDTVNCGPHALCVANNHVAQCQCPPGLFAGDPNTSGCQAVPCVYNNDCPAHQLCDRLSHTCYDVCEEDTCGDNAVCIAEDHKSVCQCPSGYKPNPLPDVECVPTEVCNPNPCHTTALCEPTPSVGHTCRCPPNHVGDPFTEGCRPEGNCPNGDKDCPDQSACVGGKCINPCDNACGSNTLCNIVDRQPVCECLPKFSPVAKSAAEGCLRELASCASDADCAGNVCINGQCEVVCRKAEDCSMGERCVGNKCQVPCVGHSQCQTGQACVNSVCVLGCRSNRNCKSSHACINNKCQDPCGAEGVCGPNAQCGTKDHATVCRCPDGFQGTPSPQQGCVRVPQTCRSKDQCARGQMCVEHVCKQTCDPGAACAAGERCDAGVCVQVCYADSNCLAGELCVSGTCRPGCAGDGDCGVNQICVDNQCRCGTGFKMTVRGCQDIDECLQSPCHQSALCTNTQGSFRCACRTGTVGDPYLSPGCARPDQCTADTDCAASLSCVQAHCVDPCASAQCAQNAQCAVQDHRAYCSCPPGHIGDPNSPDIGCYKVECVSDGDCPTDKQCDQQNNKCTNPCDRVNCGRGSCRVSDHRGICFCQDGYEFADDTCQDIDECNSSPCHQTALCRNVPGNYQCVCVDGLVGDPVISGCRKPGDCVRDSDCPDSASCIDNRCRNPCDSPATCGVNAQCSAVNHSPQCSCPPQTRGDAKVECVRVECEEHADCPRAHVCLKNACQDPCQVPSLCGENAECRAGPAPGQTTCSCRPGHTGDPDLGCVAIQYCAGDNQCPSGTRCSNGICLSSCSTSRECVSEQVCISGLCQPTCKYNQTCPDLQYCQHGICVQEVRCRSHDDCDTSQLCRENTRGQAECRAVCEGSPCGRNAECTPVDHQPKCTCKPGYHGNAQVGCQHIECTENRDCSSDKLCEQHMCKISCLANNPCGAFSLCSAENHQQVCYCQPGYTGDPYSGCSLIDFCASAPCGPGAHCDNSRGSYKCLCPLDTVGDPYRDGCRPPVECETDLDCPAATKCVKDNGEPKCKDVCEGVLCGPNAECVATDRQGVCECLLGYEGTPSDSTLGCRPTPVHCLVSADCPHNTYCYQQACRPWCQSDSECGLTEQCVQGQCVNPCESREVCGMNAECRIYNHVRQCSCPSGFTGNHSVECVRIPISCSSNAECSEDSHCENGMCRPVCLADNDCAFNEKCLKGSCILTCRVDHDCFLGHICLHNMCIYGCHSDEDCSASESCRDNKCSSPCLSAPCGPNAVCGVTNHRATCSCRHGLVPNPTAQVACVRAPAPPCSGSRDCESGSVCQDSVCRAVCTSTAACLSNEQCDAASGTCKPLCRRDADCRSGELCDNLMCVAGCRSDNHCPEDKACVNNKCIDLCGSLTACGVNAVCLMHHHQKQCTCPPPLLGNAEVSCHHTTTPCIAQSDCPADQTCYALTCAARCRTDFNCLSDERCVKGVCRRICNSDAKCGNHQICENRLCVAGCRSDTSCPDTQACINKQCRDPCEGATTCGSCAECRVVNHGVQCSCPAGTVGNPQITCVTRPARCDGTCVCDDSTGFCIKSCQVNQDCACGEVCTAGICSMKCSSNIACPQGFVCENGACLSGCRVASDCGMDKACFNGRCQDPCSQETSPCGVNALCRVSEHRPVCLCPEGYQGEPSRGCEKAMCTSNSDCEANQHCAADGACRNPCLEPGVCGHNAQCKVLAKRPQCSCPPGYQGNPLTECKQGGETCSRNPCGEHTRCRNIPGGGVECSCEPGCVGDPYQGCVCQRSPGSCQDMHCGVNAACKLSQNLPTCYCPTKYPLGDPNVQCSAPVLPKDCRTMGCGKLAECVAAGDKYECQCPSGMVGNAQVECSIVLGCISSEECAPDQSCVNGACINPCHISNPCAPHHTCQVEHHNPVCVKVCECQHNLDCRPSHRCDGCSCIADSVVEPTCNCGPGIPCDPITGACLVPGKVPTEKPGCSSDDECPLTDTCVNRRCVNPCSTANPCAATALCEAANHRAVCKCPPGFVGNALVNCYREPQQSPECTADSECPSNRACVNQRCQDPCTVANPCGLNAECVTSQHRPVCNCPNGWAGNPQVQCYKPECKVDADCLYDKACVGGSCVSPCQSVSCGRGAECKVTSPHRATCVCPAGTQGNPLLSCVSVQCHYNEDCADHEACDRLNRVCRPVCEADTCADSAHCTARNHQPTCSCPPGTEGNPYIDCISQDHRTPIAAGCESDTDCPSKLACINTQCADPCRVAHMCSPDQLCLVQDSLPLRTVYCQCPPDTVADSSGRCKLIAQPIPQCRVDADCAQTERCVRGSCAEACHVDPCGLNALCTSQFHTAVCSCPSGFVGNPHLECSFVPAMLPPVVVPECVRDDECPWDRSCNNQRCVNPCVADHCSRGAFCHVENHHPVCRCPQGFQGDPRIECRPPAEATVGCSSNSECSLKESCINRLCINPCNCGPNAECRVTNHYAICFCRPGYSGNPQIGCVKLGCESDDQCSNDKMCYNGECINPCIVGDPCVANAQCTGVDHRATCHCLPGYEGNPLVRCSRVECRIDADCPQDRACVDQHCVNPCDNPMNPPCAANALCYVRNHYAACRCPDHLPMGNPMAYCERRMPPLAEPECRHDPECPSQLACIRNTCVNPCIALSPCAASSRCSVLDTMPVRTMICTCPDGWVPNNEGECRPVVVPSPPGCTTDQDCPATEACINRMCRNPCNCGTNTNCFVQNHRPICSCMEGFDGNPNVACRAVGCRSDSECESNKACVNSVCLNPCVVSDPCGINAECYAVGRRAECRCYSGYRGNPRDRCIAIGCRSNSDCPDDRACINGQCINPCVYEHPCASQAECLVHNHLALCRCPAAMVGNPYTACRPEITAECKADGDCPAPLACFNGKCKEPCGVLTPCNRPSTCQAISSLPVRTMICVCPDGFISSGSGTCKPVMDVGGCTSDSECASDKACINAVCRDPCRCGPNAECRVRDHKPVCSCLPGFDGNPELNCVKIECRSDSDCSGTHACVNRLCVPACAADGSSCGTGAICYGAHHRAVCQCQPGLTGDANIACTIVACRADSDCPTDRSCVNALCVNPCAQSNPCQQPAECVVYDHQVDCSCPPGFIGDRGRGCERVEVVCVTDSDCPSQTACINEQCVNPCNATAPCGVNTRCQVFDTPVWRTMVCECLPGYQGNAAVRCDLMPVCAVEKGYIVDEAGNCVCPPGTALNPSDECVRCLPERGQRIDERGRCVCALERGMIIDERGNCVCPTEFGYRLDHNGNCAPSAPPPECESNDQCPDHLYCNLETKTCQDPCQTKRCGINALCNATRHQAVCQCIFDYYGDPEVMCNTTSHLRTDFPRPDMVVSCLSDGVQVEIHITEKGFNGVLYVKGHSKDEECRRVVTLPSDSQPRTEIFKVHFGTCGLIHVNGQASFVLVIQKHPKLVTYKAQAYHIKCVYATGEQNVTLGFNVSMLTTAGTIANTGPPPTCAMRIVTHSGQEINSAEIGDNLMLQVDVQPSSIYGGFARSCVAKTMEDSVENEYIVTDENGCATDPSIFGEWDHNAETQSLLAGFNAFKFPSSDNIRFQCNIRVCFGKCQPVNCRGYNAFGRRRRSLDNNNNTSVDVAESVNEGQLREEITIQSNAILTFERKEERYVSPTEAPDIQQVEDICVSMIGFIIALIMTALLALVAVAVAVSCWLIAYRRRPKVTGPLPHPPEFPNPLFTTPEPVAEPSPDYLS